jgi:chromatin structure-remodeling complex subunit SFH1
MQPNALAASGKGDNTPAAAGKRSRAAVNYAELEGLAADLVEEEPKGGMVPKRGLVPGTLGGGAVEAKQAWGDGKSYLGVLPPGNMVIVQQAIKTKHQVL